MYLYHSKLADPAWLEKMLFGRRDTADWLEKTALLFAESGKATHSLLIGNRGMGKSHLMSVLYHRLAHKEVVRKNVVIAYLEEDPYGIANYLDLLRRILKAIAQKEQHHAAKQQLQEAHQTLVATDAKLRIARAERILLEHLAGRRMLLLVENLNNIFEALGEEGQSRWRDFLQANDNTMICASSQAIFSDVQSRERPFFGFFHISYLQKLRYTEARDLLLAMAEAQKNTELIAYVDTPEGEAKLRAIFELTEGNHRLLVAFYEFFMAEFRSELSKSFLRTVDQMKPYYESFLKLLPPQQQKIVQFLVQERIPQPGRAIADNCFLPINVLSKQMSELQRLGYVQNTRQGRDAYYEITEPMLRMCLESNETTDGILSIFVDFLGNLYPVSDLKFYSLQFHLFAEILSDPGIRAKMADEAYLYKKTVRRYHPDFEPDTSALLQLREAAAPEQERMLRRMVEDSEFDAYKDDFYDFVEKKQYREAEKLIEKAFPNHLSHYYWRLLGDLFAAEGRIAEAEVAYQKSVDIKPTDAEVWNSLGVMFLRNNRIEEAVAAYKKVVEIEPDKWETLRSLVVWLIRKGQIDQAKNIIELFIKHNNINIKNQVIDVMIFEVLLWSTGNSGFFLDDLKYEEIKKDGENYLYLLLLITSFASKQQILPLFKGVHFNSFLKKCKKGSLPRALQRAAKSLLQMELLTFSSDLHDFHAALTEVFGHKTSMRYPLKFLKLGIRYVKENDPKALLELTLEERRVFEREVLGKAAEDAPPST